MQGLLEVRKLPVLTEKGVSVGVGEDMAFAVGRRRFTIRPFHLPPLESEEGDAGGGVVRVFPILRVMLCKVVQS